MRDDLAPRRVDPHVLDRHRQGPQEAVRKGPRALVQRAPGLGVADLQAQLVRDLGRGEEPPRHLLDPLAVELALGRVVRALEVIRQRPQHLVHAIPRQPLGHLPHRAVRLPSILLIEIGVHDLLEALTQKAYFVFVHQRSRLLEHPALLPLIHELLGFPRVFPQHAGQQLDIHARAHDRRLGDHGVEFLVERFQPSQHRRLQGGRHRRGLDSIQVPHPVRGPEQALGDQSLERFLDEQGNSLAGFVQPLEEGGGRGVTLQDVGHHLGNVGEGKRAESHPLEVLGLAQ